MDLRILSAIFGPRPSALGPRSYDCGIHDDHAPNRFVLRSEGPTLVVSVFATALWIALAGAGIFLVIRDEAPVAIAGVLAIVAILLLFPLLRFIIGRDTIEILDDGLRWRRAIGPFGSTREARSDDLSSIIFGGAQDPLTAVIRDERVKLATLGDEASRRRVYEVLRIRFPRQSKELPPGWTATRLPDSTVVLRGPRDLKRGCIGFLLVPGVLWWTLIALFPAHWFAFVIGAVLLAPPLIAADARSILEVRGNWLAIGQRLFGRNFTKTFRDATLHVRRFQTRYGERFDVTLPIDKRRFVSVGRFMDPADAIALARFVAKTTGWKLEITPQAM